MDLDIYENLKEVMLSQIQQSKRQLAQAQEALNEFQGTVHFLEKSLENLEKQFNQEV